MHKTEKRIKKMFADYYKINRRINPVTISYASIDDLINSKTRRLDRDPHHGTWYYNSEHGRAEIILDPMPIKEGING